MRFMMLMIPKGYEQAAPGTMPDPKMAVNPMTLGAQVLAMSTGKPLEVLSDDIVAQGIACARAAR